MCEMFDGICITREQIEEWAGRKVTDEDMDLLDRAISCSSVPDAIYTILSSDR